MGSGNEIETKETKRVYSPLDPPEKREHRGAPVGLTVFLGALCLGLVCVCALLWGRSVSLKAERNGLTDALEQERKTVAELEEVRDSQAERIRRLDEIPAGGIIPAGLQYSDITVTIDGLPVWLADMDGNEVRPIVVDGTNYLPVYALANFLEMDVKWNGQTNTVEFTAPLSTDIMYPKLLGFYKLLQEGFDGFGDDFDAVLSGAYDELRTTVLTDGPNAGRPFLDVKLETLRANLDFAEELYSDCYVYFTTDTQDEWMKLFRQMTQETMTAIQGQVSLGGSVLAQNVMVCTNTRYDIEEQFWSEYFYALE